MKETWGRRSPCLIRVRWATLRIRRSQSWLFVGLSASGKSGFTIYLLCYSLPHLSQLSLTHFIVTSSLKTYP